MRAGGPARSRYAAWGAVTAFALVLVGCSEPSTTAPVGATPSPAPSGSTSTATTTPPSPTGTADPAPSPLRLGAPFVARVVWVRATGGRSLRVYPTPNGRRTEGAGDADVAWAEVLRLAPDADQPGMRAQFDCHWTYARLVTPDKPSWNLEPWRPVVSPQQLVDAGCNPGGPESAES